jgi:hypothetical protein
LIAEKRHEALGTRETLDRAAVSNLSAIGYQFGPLENLRMTAIKRYMSGMRRAHSDVDEEADPREALRERFFATLANLVLGPAP